MTPLLHITSRSAWDTSGVEFTDPSLDTEGFIHCSTPDHVLIPANERFRGRTDLVVLVIDPMAVPAKVVFEDCDESGTEFPHVYGPIPRAAVTQILPFPCRPDGTFALPSELA